MARQWWVRVAGKVHGPLEDAKLSSLAKSGKIAPDTELATSADGPWHQAGRVKGLVFAPSTAPAAKAAGNEPPVPASAVVASASAPRAARVSVPATATAEGNAEPPSAASHESRAYSHSGAVPPLGALAAIAAGLVAALVLALIYTILVVWVPLVYNNAIAAGCFWAAFFGGLLGACVSWASKLGHVRNPLFVTLVAVACAAVGIYAEWGYTPSILFDSSIGVKGFRPGNVLTTMRKLYEHGSWNRFGFTCKGPMLELVWIVEWIVIVFCSGVSSYVLTGMQPYCEACRAWTVTRKGVNYLAAPPDKTVAERLSAGDLRPLGNLVKATAATPSHWRLDVASCPRCPQSHFLIANEVTITVNEKKEKKENEKWVGSILRLAPAEVEFVTACGRPPPVRPQSEA